LWQVMQVMQNGQGPTSSRLVSYCHFGVDAGLQCQSVTFENVKKAIEVLAFRHDSLKTNIHIDKSGKPSQYRQSAFKFCHSQHDLTDTPKEQRQRQLDQLINNSLSMHFDLRDESTLRVIYIRLDDERVHLLLSCSPMFMDGGSILALSQSLVSQLHGRDRGEEPVDYSEFTSWQNELIDEEDEEWEDGQDFWQEQTTVLPLLSQHGDDAIERDFKLVNTCCPSSKTWQQYAANNKTSLEAMCQGAWFAVLGGLFDKQMLSMGIIADARHEFDALKNSLGLYTRLVPFTHKYNSGHRFADLSRFVGEQKANVLEWQDYFAPKAGDKTPEVLFEFHHCASLDIIAYSADISLYKLKLQVLSGDNGLDMSIAYDPDYFGAEYVQSLLTRIGKLLDTVVTMGVATGDVNLGEIDLIVDYDRLAMAKLNAQTVTDNDTIPSKRVHQLFEYFAANFPQTKAIVDQQTQLNSQLTSQFTYGEANAQANRLANYLIKQGIKQDVTTSGVVSLCMERSASTIIAMLAVLKTGCAYVVIEKNQAINKITKLSAKVKSMVMLTDFDLDLDLDLDPDPDQGKALNTVLNIDKLTLDADAVANPDIAVSVDDLAYIIFTSGSSGEPKAVAIEHGGISNYIHSYQPCGFARGWHYGLVSTLSADLGNTPIYAALTTGGCLHMIDFDTATNGVLYGEYCKHWPIDVLKIVPSHLNALLDSQQTHSVLPSKFLVCGGEALTNALIDKIYSDEGDTCQVINSYGPSETTVASVAFILSDKNTRSEMVDFNSSATLPIGKPLCNTQVAIVDEQLQPVASGVKGELLIAGAGVARGYIGDEQQTGDKFVELQFAHDHKPRRYYRTGDSVKLLSHGNIEYVGRVDSQVKIRGFRVELGAVEKCLQAFDTINQVVALAQKDESTGTSTLVAYVVANRKKALVIEDVRRQLAGQVIDYMVPSQFYVVDAIPITVNGKVDSKALKKLATDSKAGNYSKPETAVEQHIANVWQEVLGIDKVGRKDDFFVIGGHSLLAIDVATKLRDIFNINLAMTTLFNHSSLISLAEFIEGCDKNVDQSAMVALTKQQRTQALPLSYAQQRLWFIDQLDSNSAQYNIPAAVKLIGTLNIAALEQSVSCIVQRHESLRTCFVADQNNQPHQVIRDATALTITVDDISASPEQLSALVGAEMSQGFNLSSDLMLRVKLLKLGETEHVLLVTMHHIASDGWSMGVLINEFTTLYQAFDNGQSNPLAPLDIQYADYAHWQRNWLKDQVLSQQMDYWVEQLADLPAVHSLGLDYARPPMQSFVGDTYRSKISAQTNQALNKFCQDNGASLFMGIHAAFCVLLARYSNETDIVVGSPIANREQAQIAPLIGFFVNNLVLRSDLSGEPTFNALLQRSKQTLVGAYDHQQVPFEKIVEQLQPQRSLSHGPLFQVMLTLQNNQEVALKIPGLQLSELQVQAKTAKYDLALTITESEQGLLLAWEYNTDLFFDATITRLAGHFDQLLGALLSAPQQSVFAVDMMKQAEVEQQLALSHDSTAQHSKDLPVHQLLAHQLFESQVANAPDAVAVVIGTQQLTYAQLNGRANQLACYLVENKKVKPDTLVGICAERSVEMVVGILAILKAGGAYVPLDPNYPASRLSYMLEDAKLTTVLTQRHLSGSTPVTDEMAVYLDDDVFLSYSADNVEIPGLRSNHLAYVIYTSGSTGQPKGVCISHENWQAYAGGIVDGYQLTADDKVLQFSSISFDIFVEEFTAALLNGATLVMSESPQVPSTAEFWQLLAQHQVTIATLPTAYWHQLCVDEGLKRQAAHSSLRLVIVGGEAISAAHLQNWQQGVVGIKLFNTYGPTETTVIASSFEVTEFACQGNAVPIGKATANSRLYVLDKHHKVVPQGVAGELYIGGDSLARGYLNQPALTKEAFVQVDNQRLYKTGDLVRWLPHENLAFLGRIDQQVKIRGFRIELGEIEHVLTELPTVNEALVIANDTENGKQLVAYVTTDGDKPALRSSLRPVMVKQLPDYMVPAAFVVLDSLPLTANGKVDRSNLPEPDMSLLQSEMVEPATDNEKELCGIFASLLGLERVGITDDFFKLGGHSLLATQLTSRIAAGFDREVPLQVIFENPTVSQIADYLDILTQINDTDGVQDAG
ncbi:MAG: amino acid adenylation domain-containing protein, partial [Algicola sp.]|nr:amino acid adenylation domain-containing protein [Algicola sp.]